ncbi:MAG TPA: hypothetical protein VM282_20415 [Acidimicrobiales bacterium]|nr:hypothetical protein [Acidimicrobiales bacterium]
MAIGDEVVITVLVDDFADAHTERFSITGIGTTPRELVADETVGFGIGVSNSMTLSSRASGAYRRRSGRYSHCW